MSDPIRHEQSEMALGAPLEPMMTGVIRPTVLPEILQHLTQSGYTGKMVLFGPEGSGLIYFRQGRLMHADNHVRTGKVALVHLLLFMHTGHYQFWDVPVNVEPNIDMAQVLMWAAKIKDDCELHGVTTMQGVDSVIEQDALKSRAEKSVRTPSNIPLHPVVQSGVTAQWEDRSEFAPPPASALAPPPVLPEPVSAPEEGAETALASDLEFDDPPTAELLTTVPQEGPAAGEGTAKPEWHSMPELLVAPDRVRQLQRAAVAEIGPMGKLLLLITGNKLGLSKKDELPVVPVSRQIEFTHALISAMQLKDAERIEFERLAYTYLTE